MERIHGYLTENIWSLINKIPSELKREVCEIRLRKAAPLSLSTYGKNYFITSDGKITQRIQDSVLCNAADLSTTVNRLCQGSVYRYMTTINSGYIVTDKGIRVGICGESIYDNGRIGSVSSFSSINIRLSRNIENAGDAVSKFISKNKGASVLIVSPPGYGKTTVIRSVANSLAKGKFTAPMRVSVIDERGEILPEGSSGLTDRFLGYSKADGIEIAVRLFSPEYIICDEIGLSDETKAMLSVQNSGVPFVATAHGESMEQAIKKPNIKELIEHKVFNTFVRLEKSSTGSVCIFEEKL